MLSFLKSVVWGQSSGAEDTAAHGDEAAVDRVGFQVMYVRPDSPAHLAGLLPVFDYIVAANGTIFFVCLSSLLTHTRTALQCFGNSHQHKRDRKRTTTRLWSWCRRRRASP